MHKLNLFQYDMLNLISREKSSAGMKYGVWKKTIYNEIISGHLEDYMIGKGRAIGKYIPVRGMAY